MRVEKARRRDLAQPRHSGGVAQWIEQEPSKLKVAGSIPAAPASRNACITSLSAHPAPCGWLRLMPRFCHISLDGAPRFAYRIGHRGTVRHRRRIKHLGVPIEHLRRGMPELTRHVLH
jgi:hypothetical protein